MHSIFFFFPFVPSNKGTGTVNLSNFSFSVWAFCGVRPHKKCSQKFWKFWKKFYVQILKILISNFGSKKHSNRRILVSEVQKNNFCDQKKFLNFFDFWTLKIFKNFWKICQIFSIFFFKIFHFLIIYCRFLDTDHIINSLGCLLGFTEGL